MAKKFIIKFETKEDRKDAKEYFEDEMNLGNENIKKVKKEDKKTLILTAKKGYGKKDILEDLKLDDIIVKSVKKFKEEKAELTASDPVLGSDNIDLAEMELPFE